MRNILFALALALATGGMAHACDLCGCGASSQYLGVLPRPDYNFAGIQYQGSRLSGAFPSPYENQPAELSEDYYHTLQLWGRYNIAPRYQLYAFVPFQYNVHRTDSATTTTTGIGDISALLNRIWLNKEGKTWSHLLQGGGGIKAPTGRHAGITELDRQGLPNMQPGTGAWDFMTNANYTLRRNKTGANLDASYMLTTANKDSYKYGNRLTVGAVGFYNLKIKEMTLLPQAGLRYEYALHDYDNYGRKWLNEQTGGYMCFATAAVQGYYKNYGARIAAQLPLGQHYSEGYTTALAKWDAGIFLLF